MKKIFLATSAALLPGVAFAQTTIVTILGTVKTILDTLIPILITLAIIYFFWGLAQFIMSAGDAGAQETGQQINKILDKTIFSCQRFCLGLGCGASKYLQHH